MSNNVETCSNVNLKSGVQVKLLYSVWWLLLDLHIASVITQLCTPLHYYTQVCHSLLLHAVILCSKFFSKLLPVCQMPWLTIANFLDNIIIIIIRHAPYQCVAPLATNSLHSDFSKASSIASSKVRLCRDRSLFKVAIQEVKGRPTGLLQSL